MALSTSDCVPAGAGGGDTAKHVAAAAGAASRESIEVPVGVQVVAPPLTRLSFCCTPLCF